MAMLSRDEASALRRFFPGLPSVSGHMSTLLGTYHGTAQRRWLAGRQAVSQSMYEVNAAHIVHWCLAVRSCLLQASSASTPRPCRARGS